MDFNVSPPEEEVLEDECTQNSKRKHTLDMHVKWQKTLLNFPVTLESSIQDIKAELESITKVPTVRQKLLGLVKAGKRIDESVPLIQLDPNHLSYKMDGDRIFGISLIGTPDEKLIADPTLEGSTVVNDLSITFSPATEEWHKLRKHTESTVINFIEPPRQGKKLLVCDLDHCLLDFSEKETTPPEQMKRPYLDYFLTEVYAEYDIVS